MFRLRTPQKRYKPKNKADVDKISQAFAKMMQEDLTMKAVNDSANHQTLLYGMGDQHIDIIVSKLLERYKVEVEAVPSEGSLPRDDPQKIRM